MWNTIGLLAGYAVLGGLGVAAYALAGAYVHPLWRARALALLRNDLTGRGWGGQLPVTPERLASLRRIESSVRDVSSSDADAEFRRRAISVLQLAGRRSDDASAEQLRRTAEDRMREGLETIERKLAGCATADGALAFFPWLVRRESARLWKAALATFWRDAAAQASAAFARALERATVQFGVGAVAVYPFISDAIPQAWDWPTYVGWCVAVGLAAAALFVVGSEGRRHWHIARGDAPPLDLIQKASALSFGASAAVLIVAIRAGWLVDIQVWSTDQADAVAQHTSPIASGLFLAAVLEYAFVAFARQALNPAITALARADAAACALGAAALLVGLVGILAAPNGHPPTLAALQLVGGVLLYVAAVVGAVAHCTLRLRETRRSKRELDAAGRSVNPKRFNRRRAFTAITVVIVATVASSVASSHSGDPNALPVLQLVGIGAFFYSVVQVGALWWYLRRIDRAYEQLLTNSIKSASSVLAMSASGIIIHGRKRPYSRRRRPAQ